MRRRHLPALLLAPALAPAGARAQGWPQRPVRVIVPFPPGGSNDVMARPLAEKLQARFGQPFVVENRPGAGGAIGAAQVAQAPADGHTLMVTSSSFAGSAVVQRTPYDALTDFTPVALLARSPFIVLTHLNFPPRDIRELIAYARENPGRVDYGSSGAGSIGHFVTEMLALAAGLRLNHIPYRGMGPAVTDLVAGHIQLLITTIASASGVVRENRVRLLAWTGPGAPPGSPAAPLLREATGLDYEAAIWWGLLAPRGLPAEILATLNGAVQAALADPAIARLYETEGATPAPGPPHAFAATLAADIARFRAVAQAAGIRGE
ncbi:MAG: tripartite tricarboxylate transporter substrate-binding protein [Roseococcus sp.]|nr:tripartite tricarboxylate transporter substrate-binding protein [Roseococcus sp.]